VPGSEPWSIGTANGSDPDADRLARPQLESRTRKNATLKCRSAGAETGTGLRIGVEEGLRRKVSDDSAFDFLCDELERVTSLDRLEARGTVRIAVKQAGLDPRQATPAELAVVVEKVLSDELSTRGIESPESVCSALAKRVAVCRAGESRETPEAIFARLGSR